MGSALRGGVHRWAASVRGWPVFELAGWLQAYVFAVIAADVAAITAAAPFAALHGTGAELFAVLLGCDLATVELTRRSGEPSGLIKEIHAVWELPLALLLPPFFGLIAPIARIMFTQWRVRSTLFYRRVFTAAVLGLSYGLASVIFHRLAPALTALNAGPGARVEVWALAVVACGVLRSAVNKVLIMVAVKGAEPDTSVRAALFNREALFGDLAELSVGVLVAFTVTASAWLALCALPCVILLQRSQRHSQLESESRIDDRTGLLNAKTWQREAAVRVDRASHSGHGTPLAVAIVDIDRFKEVNRAIGHLAAHAVLATVALTMKAELRETDLCGRYGGDEFAVLLLDAGPAEAEAIAQRLCDAVARITFAEQEACSSGGPLRVTVSVGVAVLDGTYRDLDELIAAADVAMYRAKQDGNRIHLVTT